MILRTIDANCTVGRVEAAVTGSRGSRRFGTPALLALAAGVFGAAAASVALTSLLSDRNIVVHPNVVVNPEGIIDANNSPTVARNPTDPDNLVVVNRVDRPRFSAALHWSVDGGTTWRTTGLPLPRGKDRPFAPDVAFSPSGVMYVTYVNLTGRGNVPENLWMARSEDGGMTLSDPVRVAGELTFQARLAVGPGGRVYITYLQASEVGLLKLIGTAPVVAVHSADHGRTFSSPVLVSDDGRRLVGAAAPAVDSNGDLVVLYVDYKDDVRDFQNLEGPVWERPFALVLTRSDDGGGSFAPGGEIEAGVVPAKRFLAFLPEFPSLAAGPDGVLYAAWSDGRNGDEDVFLLASDDGAESWSSPLRINDDPKGDGSAQSLPAVAAAPNGRVDVLFLDHAGRASGMTAAVLATSSDGGRTFTDMPVSSASFDARVGPSAAPHLPPDAGSRLGLESWDDGAFAAWSDTRFGDQSSGRQDIIGARLAVPNPGARRTKQAVVVALIAAAALTLVGWKRAVRRGDEAAA